ncbi:hypothetical protein [Paraburkholderia aspalathi]|uniref:hypothetical protein n=1 Tax=Paraburkholderia aspalathi TaxID=1324617 RepID=UPI0038B8A78C
MSDREKVEAIHEINLSHLVPREDPAIAMMGENVPSAEHTAPVSVTAESSSVLHEILEWSLKRPEWQRDALRRRHIDGFRSGRTRGLVSSRPTRDDGRWETPAATSDG